MARLDIYIKLSAVFCKTSYFHTVILLTTLLGLCAMTLDIEQHSALSGYEGQPHFDTTLEVLYTMDTFWAPTKWDGTADRLPPGWFIADVLTQSTTYKEILILLKARKRQYACSSMQKYTWKRKGSIPVMQIGWIWLFSNLYLVCLVYLMERLLGADYRGSFIVAKAAFGQNMQNQMTTATAFQIPATALPFLAAIVVEATINTKMAPFGIRKYNERLSMTVHTLWQWSVKCSAYLRR